ncbi:hypothetical protein niasHT_017072 [Heterodera trifolii]|uniref:Ground-like domain-containing protein n=1 Tax=Heterodera trifolii TaxID=157864 RepID=A0ABD2KXZ7_9BILA
MNKLAAVLSIVFFIINHHFFAFIRGQLGEQLKSIGTVKGIGNQLPLLQISDEPMRQTMNYSAPLKPKREMRGEDGGKAEGKAGGEAEGCFRDKRRRRRRRQMGCPCFGCANCGYDRCNEQRAASESVPISIAQPQNAIVPLPLQQISPLTSYKIAPQQLNALLAENDWYSKQKTAENGQEQTHAKAGQFYPLGFTNAASANADQIQPQHSLTPVSSADEPTIKRQHAAIVHRPHSDSGYAKIPQLARKYPLPECYTDESSFMCCNAQLEETIHRAFQHLIDTIHNFHNCNIQKISSTVQSFAEKQFNISFEVVTGLTDYASKSHFYSNYICKVQRGNRYILAYATPRWEIEENGRNTNQHFVL